MYQCSTSTFGNLCGCTDLNMLEWMEMAKQIGWQAKQPSQMLCVSEDLTCWGAWDTTCWHKAKDITPSIAWRREGWKERIARRYSLKGREGDIISQTNTETISKATYCGNFWEMRWSAYGRFPVHRYHLEMNWTEWNSQSETERGPKRFSNDVPCIYSLAKCELP